VHLLDQRGIAGETAGIQTAHFVDQGLQLFARLGTILHGRTKLAEKVQSLLDLALGIGRIGTCLGRPGPALGAIPVGETASAQAQATCRIAHRTGEPIADLTCLASAGILAALLALLPTGLALLLPGLTVASERSALELLASGTTGLTLTLLRSRLRVGTSTNTGDLVAQTRQVVHGAVERDFL
jgi:hypothetical protein